jgi:hypothetical protein
LVLVVLVVFLLLKQQVALTLYSQQLLAQVAALVVDTKAHFMLLKLVARVAVELTLLLQQVQQEPLTKVTQAVMVKVCLMQAVAEVALTP